MLTSIGVLLPLFRLLGLKHSCNDTLTLGDLVQPLTYHSHQSLPFEKKTRVRLSRPASLGSREIHVYPLYGSNPR